MYHLVEVVAVVNADEYRRDGGVYLVPLDVRHERMISKGYLRVIADPGAQLELPPEPLPDFPVMPEEPETPQVTPEVSDTPPRRRSRARAKMGTEEPDGETTRTGDGDD